MTCDDDDSNYNDRDGWYVITVMIDATDNSTDDYDNNELNNI